MAEVPGAGYEPYFTAQPTERPVQLRGVDAPPAAFGVNVANAIQTFGGDVEKGSNEVFSRAMALRRLQVEGNIRDLTTQYYNEVAPIQERFLTAQGNNASQDALNGHMAQIEQVRQKYLGQAQQFGPYGANIFGNEASSMQRNFIQNATRWSSAQTREATKQSHRALISTLQDQATSAQTPEAMKTINDKITAEQAEIDKLDGITDPGVTAWNTHKEVSSSNTANIIGSLRNNPEAGIRKAQAAMDGLTGPDQFRVQQAATAAIPSATNQYLTRLYAGHTLDLGNSKIDPDRGVETLFQMEGHTRGPVIWNRTSKYYGQQALPGGVMPGNLKQFLKDAGMPSMTEEEYANDPAAQRQLMRFKFNQFQEQYGSANDAFSMWFTGRPMSAQTLGLRDQNISNLVYLQRANQFLARGATPKQIADAAEGYGNSLASNLTPDAGQQARQYAESHTYRQKALEREARDDLHDKFDRWVVNNPGQGWNEFQADPANQALITQGLESEPDFVRRWPQMINARVKAVEQETNKAHFDDLMSSYVSGDMQKFMDSTANVWEDKQLGEGAKMTLTRLRGDIHRTGYKDANVTKIFKEMEDKYYNEIPNKQNDAPGHNAYLSSLYSAVEAYEEKTKAPFPTNSPEGIKAMEDIHKWLLSKDPTGVQTFRDMKVSDAYYREKKARDPYITDDTIRYEWLADQARKHFDQEFSDTAKQRAVGMGRVPFTRGVRGEVPFPTPVYGPQLPPRQFGARGEIAGRRYQPWQITEPEITEVTGFPQMSQEAAQTLADYWGQMAQRAREAEARRQARRTGATQEAKPGPADKTAATE